VSSAALLATLESTLRRIETLTPSGKPAWDADEVRQLAVERLWIAAGNLAEAYRKAAELPPGVEPWAELYGFRSVLAHALPGDISSDRVWHETTDDLPRLLAQVHVARGA
jgi:uncharacterized protein with HEPN domain